MYPNPQRNEVDVVFKSAPEYAKAALEERDSKASYLVIKRIMDVMLALIGLVLLSPLFILVALLIKMEDPKGSVFFYQTRIGKNERPFRMYKFRSMVSNAEELLEKLLDQNEVGGAMFKMKEDPRITKIGKFIRKTSIDELPQLWNVVRGDMSLVGPRPALPREVMQYTSYDKQRLSVSPGCTGLWQVSGRNNLSFQEMLELDLEYIERRNLWLDIKVMLRTVKVMVFPNSAY
ncbi:MULTISPECIES: sugar transferase [Paenibacillus]|uniref:Exopolysaccharide biosynthesis polyprenyl glycosylphosphotransferase n=1 Tax=Paenibacillus campinasensis TaxID=66347 RepID=A0A268EZ56_9BACL|nr:sugar transferase [Paenibacillus campinasensis]MUG65131.1 exopolysaccharide biosynthesis polyprenyl glycosylphosphotransferase [Paenibacillus campinasensis]PAD78399.1 multidrug MFS transporter [Paenibacillus campinasensis]